MTLVPKEALYAMFKQWKPFVADEQIYCDFVLSQSEEFFLKAPLDGYYPVSHKIAETHGTIARKYPRWMPWYVNALVTNEHNASVELVTRVGIKVPVQYLNVTNLRIFMVADMIDYSFNTVYMVGYPLFDLNVLRDTPIYWTTSKYGGLLLIANIDCDGFAAYAAAQGLDDPRVEHWITHNAYKDHPQAAELHRAMSKYFDNADNPKLICRKTKRERAEPTAAEDE